MIPNSAESGHVKLVTHDFSSAVNHTLAAHCATIDIMRRNANQTADGFMVNMP